MVVFGLTCQLSNSLPGKILINGMLAVKIKQSFSLLVEIVLVLRYDKYSFLF